MTTPRTWLYNLLKTTPSLVALHEGRVFGKNTMTSSVVSGHPFLVYKLGNDTSEELSEEVEASRQFIQIYVHDFADINNADYMKIDDVLVELRKALKLASSTEAGVIAVRYLETSQDLDDQTMGTVMKYIRFQLILGRAT